MSDVHCETSPRDKLMVTPFLLQVAAVLDVMGEASAKAQGLKTAITSGIRQSFKNQQSSRKDEKCELVAMEARLADSHRQAFGVSVSSTPIILQHFPPKYSGLGLGNFQEETNALQGMVINPLLDKYFDTEFKLCFDADLVVCIWQP